MSKIRIDDEVITACGGAANELKMPTAMIDALLICPYAAGKGDLHGADCWGVVELWYRHVLGVELNDRAEHPAGHRGMQAGYDVAERWTRLEEPENHCLVIMRVGELKAGHVGIFYEGSILHSDEEHGCQCQPITDRFLRTKITRFLSYK